MLNPGTRFVQLPSAGRKPVRYNLPPTPEVNRRSAEAMKLVDRARGLANPVIAFTILRANDPQHAVAVGPRNPAVNETHPNGISVPTHRQPLEVIEAILRGTRTLELKQDDDRQEVLIDPTSGYDGQNMLRYAVDAMLAAKMGIWEGRRDRYPYFARLSSLSLGHVVHPDENGDPSPTRSEDTLMVNVTVVLTGGEKTFLNAAKRIPRDERSLLDPVWMPIDEFLELQRKGPKHADIIQKYFAHLGGFVALCINGMCVETTARIIELGYIPNSWPFSDRFERGQPAGTSLSWFPVHYRSDRSQFG